MLLYMPKGQLIFKFSRCAYSCKEGSSLTSSTCLITFTKHNLETCMHMFVTR